MPAHIGTLAEKSLHAQLKQLYAAPGDLIEHPLDGYVVDIARPLCSEAGGSSPDYRCIEIQTRHLAAMKAKLAVLLPVRPVHVVFPIAAQRTIARMDAGGAILSRRRSPKHGSIYDIFPELVSLPALIHHPHFSLEVLLIHEEQVWRDDGRGSWRRRRWSIYDRRLLATVATVLLAGAEDFAALPPRRAGRRLRLSHPGRGHQAAPPRRPEDGLLSPPHGHPRRRRQAGQRPRLYPPGSPLCA